MGASTIIGPDVNFHTMEMNLSTGTGSEGYATRHEIHLGDRYAALYRLDIYMHVRSVSRARRVYTLSGKLQIRRVRLFPILAHLTLYLSAIRCTPLNRQSVTLFLPIPVHQVVDSTLLRFLI